MAAITKSMSTRTVLALLKKRLAKGTLFRFEEYSERTNAGLEVKTITIVVVE